jgi:hypothetical protein
MKKDIQTKAKLIELARAFGQEPDADLVAEVTAYMDFQNRIRQSVRASMDSDLALVLSTEALKKSEPEYPRPPSLDDLEQLLQEQPHELVQEPSQETIVTTDARPQADTPAQPSGTLAEQSLTDLVSASISAGLKKDSFQQPEPAASTDLVSLQRKVKYLEQWLGKVSLAGPGGGASDTSNFTSYTRLVQDSTYTVARKDYYIGVNVHAPVTITLPDTAEAGRNLVIKDESGNCKHFPITLLGNIDNDANGLILKINNGAIQLIYRDGWRII